jgi:uncharacterized protein YkwD
MHRAAIALLVTSVLGAGCSALGSTVSPSAGNADAPAAPLSVSSVADELSLCAEETNRYRASVGLRPLMRSAALEDFAAQAAAVDAAAHHAHHHFAATNGAGVSRAETEILWWRGFSVQAVVQRGLAQMWQVGPGGEHYDIMAGGYSEIGCGIAVNGAEVTVTQDFR